MGNAVEDYPPLAAGFVPELSQIADPVTRAVLLAQAANAAGLMARSLEPRNGEPAGYGLDAMRELSGCLRALAATETGTLSALPPGEAGCSGRAALIGRLAEGATHPLCADVLRALAATGVPA